MSYFSLYKRNPYHWDISGTRTPPEHGTERHWRIRGEPGRILVYDERPGSPINATRLEATFKTAYIADHYMMEET